MTRQIHVGGVAIGGGAPVSIQSMLNTATTDVEGCLNQLKALATAGCEIAWLAVPDAAAAEAFGKICAASPLPQPAYEQALEMLRRAYFPLFYPFGMNGLALSLGMNLFFKRHTLPYKARWSVPRTELWQRIGAMLERDLPVIMAVGPNFPRFWQKKGTNFFRLSPEGRYEPSVSARAHFVTATGLDDDWVELSSWGSRYYMRRDEFARYTKECSNSLLCSILYIEHK